MDRRGDSTRETLLARMTGNASPAAWREFDATYSELLLRYAQRRGAGAVDAEDVRQEVMFALFGALRGFEYRRASGSFRGYLATAVRRAVAARLVRQGRVTDAEAAAAVDETCQRDELWEEEWRQHHLRVALDVVRADFDEHTVAIFEELLAGGEPPELARRFGVQVDSVYQAKTRVRKRLREQVERQVAAEEANDRIETSHG